MGLDKHLTRNRVAELESTDLKGALRELLGASLTRFKDLNGREVLRNLLERENTMTTYLGSGVALPHVRLPMRRRYILAVGRSRTGIRYEGLKENERIHLVFLLIAGEHASDYLQVLASIARLVKEQDFVDALMAAPDAGQLYERLYCGLGGAPGKPVRGREGRMNRLVLREAGKIARGAGCSAILLLGDTFATGLDRPRLLPSLRTILVTRRPPESGEAGGYDEVIQIRSFTNQRLVQVRSAVLLGLTRGIIGLHDRLCCIGGIAGSNLFDTVVVLDVEREFPALFTSSSDFLPQDVKPEVLERVIGVATELAIEGREGKPVGSLFVLGDLPRVERLIKPLVLNPFFGYREEERNILNPFMDETIKEFSSIDGAFIIRGDGMLVSAGSLIQAGESVSYPPLPSGFGSRHAAAAAISAAADCVSIVVSSSNSQVTLFRRGVMLPLTERRPGGTLA